MDEGLASGLAGVLDGLEAPAAVLDAADWSVVRANAAFARVARGASGLEGVDGQPVGSVLPFDVSGVLAAVRRGASIVRDHRLRSDGVPGGLEWTLALQAVYDEQALRGALLVIEESATPARGRWSERPAPAVAGPAAEVFRSVLRAGLAVCKAERAAVLVGERDGVFRVAAATENAPLPQHITLADPASPVWQAARGRGLVLRSTRRDTERGRSLPLTLADRPGWEELLAVALGGSGPAPVVLVLGAPAGQEFPVAAVDRLSAVAGLASTALDQADASTRTACTQQLLLGAVCTAGALIETIDPATVRRRLLDGLVSDMGIAGAVIWGSDDAAGGRKLLNAAGLPWAVQARQAGGPAGLAGEFAELAEAVVRVPADASGWPGHELRAVRVPEEAAGVLGVFVREPCPDSGLLDSALTALAQALTTALRRARLHSRSRSVLDALRLELRPRAILLSEAVEIGQASRSASGGVDVGGGFFDGFVTATGHIGVTCGHASGKGVEAARFAALAAATLRAYALEGGAPEEVLARTNAAVAARAGDEWCCGVVYARIDPAAWTVELGVAGLPPPIVVGRDDVEVLEAPGSPPLGLDESTAYRPLRLQLVPGASLVLYTDGVTEARSPGLRGDACEPLGTTGLVAILESLRSSSAQELADGVLAGVEAWNRRDPTDDCAIIVVQRSC